MTNGVILYAIAIGRRLMKQVLLSVVCVGFIMKNLELGLYFFNIVHVNKQFHGLN